MTERSHGALLLARTELTLDEIREQLRAHKLTVSRQAVQQWVAGVTKPKPSARRLLKKLFVIPLGTWDEDPPAVDREEVLQSTQTNGAVDVFDLATRMLRTLERDVGRVESDPKLSHVERAKLRSECIKQIGQFREMQDVDGTRLIQHPQWATLWNTLANVVRSLVCPQCGHTLGLEGAKAIENAFAPIREEIAKQE